MCYIYITSTLFIFRVVYIARVHACVFVCVCVCVCSRARRYIKTITWFDQFYGKKNIFNFTGLDFFMCWDFLVL